MTQDRGRNIHRRLVFSSEKFTWLKYAWFVDILLRHGASERSGIKILLMMLIIWWTWWKEITSIRVCAFRDAHFRAAVSSRATSVKWHTSYWFRVRVTVGGSGFELHCTCERAWFFVFEQIILMIAHSAKYIAEQRDARREDMPNRQCGQSVGDVSGSDGGHWVCINNKLTM